MSNKENRIIKELEEIAQKLNVKIRYEKTKAKGGLCQINGEYMIIIDKSAAIDYKISVISRALKTFELGDFFISPKVRELLEDQ